MDPLNPYEILGVDKDASYDDIKKAYRSLAQKNHPDHGGDEDEFVRIKLAYETLSDPFKRKQYDETGLFNGQRTKKDEAIYELGNLLNWILNSFNYDTENLVERMTQEINKGIDELKSHKEKILQENIKLDLLSKNIKHKKNTNYITRHIKTKINNNKYEVERLQERIDLFLLAKEVVEEHYFD